ncbi:helix-turn-helix domain-containing protein [Thioclava sp. IC9]|uniref:AraC-like ligand-binding domain-containing protein n=1 Tax=Thioclava sp. IC9 TaxID=1973007 RepID=UPI000B542988|nr:helix-turn-helix domain-containing protein [Thioclava sp. IC9]OWY06328.1 AraC family transcriptional regulator [Thioclava sp. IC9]
MIISSGGSAMPGGRDKWQKMVSEAYFPLDTECLDRQAFRGEMQQWSLGVIGLSRIDCDGVLYQRKRHHFLNETESSLLIAIPENDEVQYSQNQRRTCCKPGSFIVERSDAPYEYWHARRNIQWVLKVPSANVRARIGPSERLGGLIFDGRHGVAGYFLSSMRAAISHIEQLDYSARETAGSHLLEMLCLAIRSDERVLDSTTSTVRAAHLYRAEQFIRANLKDPNLSPQSVARACGISLRYLQQLFSDAGPSVNGYIRDRRLTRCSEELRAQGAGATVAEIAYRWGFADQAQFSRHYKAKFGCTPTETRKEAGRLRRAM